MFNGKVSRREFIRSGTFLTASFAAPKFIPGYPQKPSGAGPIHLGLASYTFRNFTRSQLIAFMKQLDVSDLNAKDVKDHLPPDPEGEQAALADYAAAGIKLHAAGAIYFSKNDDADIRAQFDYSKR